MRQKHRKDQNHGKNGWVGGNPRYSRTTDPHKRRQGKLRKNRSMGKAV